MSTEVEHPDSDETTTAHGQSDPDPDAENEYVLDPTSTPWRRDPVMNHRSDASRKEWGDHYNIHAQFLPWAHSDPSGFEALQQLTPFFESRPATSKQVSMSRILSHLDIGQYTGDAFCLEDIALLSGWWRGGSNPASGSYFCNPAYSHGHAGHETAPSEMGDPIGDPWEDSSRFVRRLDLLDRAASMGLNADVLVQPFGVTHYDSVLKWAQHHYFAYGKRKVEGQVRMARTLKTIYAWGNVGDSTLTHDEIGAAFGVDGTTVTKRITKHAAGFEPPRDPNYRAVSGGGGE